eukprot:TRINITY_DN26081_c0_g1_i1.p1 TRINITY_DN26081_c0_g1~~TRINITY_DN26081_c0_g1_i1.p1  ORF type:complete len:486 (+),score=131.37 TRINITY_DN26081_c0_g1_i1:85-1542(+)
MFEPIAGVASAAAPAATPPAAFSEDFGGDVGFGGWPSAAVGGYVTPGRPARPSQGFLGTIAPPASVMATYGGGPAQVVSQAVFRTPPVPAAQYPARPLTPGIPSYLPSPQAAVPQPVARPQTVQSPIPLVAPPPEPPVRLTEGLPSPDAVEVQKQAYNKTLEEQRIRGEDVLKLQQKQQTDYIYQAAEAQKKQILLQIDQQAKQQELQLQQQYSNQMITLQQEYQHQKMALETQASQLVMEYQRRRSEEEMRLEQYKLQMEAHSEQMRHVKELETHQAQMHEQLAAVSKLSAAAQPAVTQPAVASQVVSPAASYVPAMPAVPTYVGATGQATPTAPAPVGGVVRYRAPLGPTTYAVQQQPSAGIIVSNGMGVQAATSSTPRSYIPMVASTPPAPTTYGQHPALASQYTVTASAAPAAGSQAGGGFLPVAASSTPGSIYLAQAPIVAACRSADARVCGCGNIFMDDSNFCRRCGRRRPTVQVASEC